MAGPEQRPEQQYQNSVPKQPHSGGVNKPELRPLQGAGASSISDDLGQGSFEIGQMTVKLHSLLEKVIGPEEVDELEPEVLKEIQEYCIATGELDREQELIEACKKSRVMREDFKNPGRGLSLPSPDFSKLGQIFDPEPEG